MSRRAMSRSRVFDDTDKLDIGRYDCGSDGSKLAFLSRGVMTAVLNFTENVPEITDLLNSVVINGANRSKTAPTSWILVSMTVGHMRPKSKLAFSSCGVMTAVFNFVGNVPDITDLLNSVVTNGANRSTLSLSR